MAAPLRVKSLYEYTSGHEDDLSFGVGQVINITEQEDDDWYGGEYLDEQGVKHEGIFPRNFVEKLEPVAPPRPTRTRTKKEPEKEHDAPPPAAAGVHPVPSMTTALHEEPAEVKEPSQASKSGSVGSEPEPVVTSPSLQKAAVPIPAPEPEPEPTPVAETKPAMSSPGTERRPSEPSSQPAAAAPTTKTKPGPPPVSDKPATSSFKDRIAAFNKPSAAPIPFKPGSLSGGYTKKPFVPPPPSRDAYVPLPKEKAAAPPPGTYRRDEDPEIKEKEAENMEQAQKAGLTPAGETGAATGEEEEDQPKPTSLKERIALLQKQQMEQAQRHADAASKKEKPKKPPTRKRTDPSSTEPPSAGVGADSPEAPQSTESIEAEEVASRTSTDDGPAAQAPPPPRRRSTKGPPPVPAVHDGNEADMSGAGDTTEGHDDIGERDDSEPIAAPQRLSRAPTGLSVASGKAVAPTEQRVEDEEEDDEEEEEEEDVDPEVKRKEELRARMAKMSGGMGFHGMFGAPMPPAAPGTAGKKKKTSKTETPAPEDDAEKEDKVEESDELPQQRAAPPIPTPMAMPGLGGVRKSEEMTRPDEPSSATAGAPPPPVPARSSTKNETGPGSDTNEEEDDEEEDNELTPAPTNVHRVPPRDPTGAPPPVPAGRPAPPPVPSETRPPPPPPPANVKTPTDGSQSDDEMSANARDSQPESIGAFGTSASGRPPSFHQALQSPTLPMRSPPLFPGGDEDSPSSPVVAASSKRNSRPPPPVPGSAPGPPPAQTRPPPPPPPGGLSRQSTQDVAVKAPSRPLQAGEENEDDATEYEGDYDTDIASSVPHKDALKAHARESSQDDSFLQSPVAEAPKSGPPDVPGSPPSRAVPPPIPSQAPPENRRRSVDAPRAAPPPPPPPKEAPPTPQQQGNEFDTYNYSVPPSGALASGYAPKTPKIEEETYFNQAPAAPQSPAERRHPPITPSSRAGTRQSLDVQRTTTRRSMDRPSMELGFIANDVDLAVQSGWWKQSNQVPPVLQGRKDIYFESEESTSTNGGTKTTVTREVFILFQDYSQSIITVRYDPYNPADVELEQRHEPPPRTLRQDEMEEFYERFGRHISEAVASKKDTVVGDGTPQGLVFELLRPFRDALRPVGTRAFGALVYANMANASTQQHDVIRAGDIMTIRNAKFQGKHGAMHAKYSMDVGKPDHVAVVAEWDGTKKKVRAFEQGRENKKVKMESFKLDDLRSGEVKIWRVMPRSWVGWNTQP